MKGKAFCPDVVDLLNDECARKHPTGELVVVPMTTSSYLATVVIRTSRTHIRLFLVSPVLLLDDVPERTTIAVT